MTAHTAILASEIRAGVLRRVGDDDGYYDNAEWEAAADYALDSGDFSELEYMQRMGRAWTSYLEASQRYPGAEHPLDFDVFCERRGL